MCVCTIQLLAWIRFNFGCNYTILVIDVWCGEECSYDCCVISWYIVNQYLCRRVWNSVQGSPDQTFACTTSPKRKPTTHFKKDFYSIFAVKSYGTSHCCCENIERHVIMSHTLSIYTVLVHVLQRARGRCPCTVAYVATVY